MSSNPWQPLAVKQETKEDDGFRMDKWKVGVFTVIGAVIGFGLESLRQIGHEKVENHKLLTTYKPEAFDIDERSFALMKKLERFGKSYPKKYVELVWILDALLFREKQLSNRNVPPLFSDVGLHPTSQTKRKRSFTWFSFLVLGA